MSAFIIQKTKYDHRSRLVSRQNNNLPKSQRRPDILLEVEGKQIYLDVGITKTTKGYHDVKVRKYANSGLDVIPIIFGKDCTIHEKSLEFLKKLKGIKESELYEKLGILLGTHYEYCVKHSTQALAEKLPEEPSVAGQFHPNKNVEPSELDKQI